MKLNSYPQRDASSSSIGEQGRAVATESPWDDFARIDAYTYIMTDIPQGNRQVFWQSGETVVSEELLPVICKNAVPLGTALEVGCGVGRLVFPLANHFERVFGLDISTEMVRQAVALAVQKNIANARFVTLADYESRSDDFSLTSGSVDFVYSLIVFQHIPDFRCIKDYFELVRLLLSPRGVAYLQFDTRPRGLAYRVKNSLPDFLLPRFMRRGIRRIRRTADELESSFGEYGLDIVENLGPKTEYNRYVLRKSKS
jgi:SAM-dependent methyltransferase